MMSESSHKRQTVLKRKPIQYVPRSVSRKRAVQSPTDNRLSQRTPRVTRQRPVEQPPPIPSYLSKTKNTKTEKPSQPKKQSLLNDPKCIALRQHFLENDDYEEYETEELSLLMEYLREYTAFCACKREYEEARNTDELYDALKDEIDMRHENQNIENDEEASTPKTAEELYQGKQSEFYRELEDYDAITLEKRRALNEKQKQDLENFEKEWSDETFLSKYRKPTQKLLSLYKHERMLGIVGDFEAARLAKLETEKQEKAETQQMQKTLIRDYNAAKAQFTRDQEKERDIFEDTRNHWRSVILARQKVEMEAVTKRENVLTQKQNAPKSHKESGAAIQARGPQATGNAVSYHRENFMGSIKLLPLPLAPNDDRVKEMQETEAKEQNKKNKKFMDYRRKKEMDMDASGSDDDMDDSDLLPAPSLPPLVDQICNEIVGEEDDAKRAEKTETFNLTQAEQFKDDHE